MPIDPRKKHRPLVIGSSISRVPAGREDHPEVGTLGAFVVDEDGKVYILSNAHVMSDDPYKRASGRVRIMQPAWSEPGADTKTDAVATVVASTIITTSGLNVADAALALVDDEVKVDPAHPSFGKLAGVRGVKKADELRMLSRTQGLHFAKVSAVDRRVDIRFIGGKLVTFTAQVELTTETLGGPSMRGDSGGMWVDADGYGCLLNFSGANYLDDDMLKLSSATVKVLDKPRKVQLVAYDSEGKECGTIELETHQEITMQAATGNASLLSVVLEWAEDALKKNVKLLM